MIPDSQTSSVYFSDLLPARHPALWEEASRILRRAGVEPRLVRGTRDVWVRDFMPVQVTADDFVLFRYLPDYLRGHAHLLTPDEVREAVPHGNLRRSPVNLDGGNVVGAGGRAFLTDKIYRENPGWGRGRLRRELAELLRAEVLVIPTEPGDVIGHADGVVRLLGEVAVVNDYSEVDPRYGARLEGTLGRLGLPVERLPHFRVDEEHDGIPSAAGNYVNFLQVGPVVLVPAYGAPEDDPACRALERLLPGTDIVPVRCDALARAGGVLNCVAWTIRLEGAINSSRHQLFS